MFFVEILVSQVAGRIFLIGEGRVNREIVRSLSERQVHKCRILAGEKNSTMQVDQLSKEKKFSKTILQLSKNIQQNLLEP